MSTATPLRPPPMTAILPVRCGHCGWEESVEVRCQPEELAALAEVAVSERCGRCRRATAHGRRRCTYEA